MTGIVISGKVAIMKRGKLRWAIMENRQTE